MKEDYLWDKTGEDSEISELENRLKTFRVSNTTSPTLPAKIFVIDQDSAIQKKPNQFFRLAFASCACLGLIAISIGLVRVFQTGDSGGVVVSSEKISKTKQVSDKQYKRVEKVSEVEKEEKPTVTKTLLIQNSSKKARVYKAKHRVPRRVKRKKVYATRSIRYGATAQKQNKEDLILSREEKDAYEQLMKALTITSTKLKIVRDKVNGAD